MKAKKCKDALIAAYRIDNQELKRKLAVAEPYMSHNTILLARALVRFARKVPEGNRRAMAELLESASSEEIETEFKRKATNAPAPN